MLSTPADVQSIWEKAELIIYRYRDRNKDRGPEFYTWMTDLVNEIHDAGVKEDIYTGRTTLNSIRRRRTGEDFNPRPTLSTNPYKVNDGRLIQVLSDSELIEECKHWKWQVENTPKWGSALSAANEFYRSCTRELNRRKLDPP